MTAAKPKRIEIYIAPDGKIPYEKWYDSLKDQRARREVDKRLERLSLGNFGDHHSITDGNGLAELRITYGPGLRIYYGETETEIVLLLCGGTKGSQKKDIQLAKEYWQEFLSRPIKEDDNEQTSDGDTKTSSQTDPEDSTG